MAAAEEEDKDKKVEKFQNVMMMPRPMNGDVIMAIANILTFVLVLGVILFIGKFLWNNYLTK